MTPRQSLGIEVYRMPLRRRIGRTFRALARVGVLTNVGIVSSCLGIVACLVLGNYVAAGWSLNCATWAIYAAILESRLKS